MAGATDLSAMVPGFDFLQGLLKNAGAGLPHIGQWVAPTLDPQELEKRISELRTVQFWLEQNARLLATTIQALEVQRMTLSTLQTMNMPLSGLSEALQIKVPAMPATPFAAAPAAAEGRPAASKPAPRPSAKTAAAAPAAVDPIQWWGALTQQFTEIAAKAVKDVAADGAGPLAAAAFKQAAASVGSAASAGGAARKAAATPVPARAASRAAAPAAPRKRR